MSDVEQVSRRGFISGLGTAVVGAAIGMVGHELLTRPAEASQPPSAAWPWPYAPMDPENARKKGHEGYYQHGCAKGTLYAFMSQLTRSVGAPYTSIPLDMMLYANGGVAGWSTLCGGLNAAGLVISLTCKDAKKISDELVTWYTQTPFPSNLSNQYAREHGFLVKKYKTDKVLPQSVPGSPLCHVNVSRWCKEHGFRSGSRERSERCARMCGDIAAKAVELMNAYHQGAFEKEQRLSRTTRKCIRCHNPKRSFDQGGFTRGKMDCSSCHVEGHVSLVSPEHPKK